MKIIVEPAREEWSEIIARPVINQSKIERIVQPILDKVQRGGDKALRKLALEYDHVELDDLFVNPKLLKAAKNQVPKELKDAISLAKENIWKFHEAQKQEELVVETSPGVTCRRKSVPIERVGLYIPGGTAPLFSTVLMLAIPAKIAGCSEIVISTPTNNLGEINPVVLYTADLLGISKVIKLGGAQAIAAMAYGTESVPKVDKIFGPGNQYVTMAKQLVSRDATAIDMPAGPSEVCVMADKHANPAFIAADLLSQAEHGVDSQVLLVARDEKTAQQVSKEVDIQLKDLPRKDLAKMALKNSSLVVLKKKKDMLDLVNKYAPEHLIIAMKDADEIADQVINAGSVFIGPYTPESAGDYASGTNHTLPTNGWASSTAGVSLDSFVKKITYQTISKKGLINIGGAIEKMAAAEQLYAHQNAVSIRLKAIRDNKK